MRFPIPHLARLALLALLAVTARAQAQQAEDSLWPRIAQGMRVVDDEEPETVTWARWYAQRPQQFNQMLARAQPFLWYIVESVELRDMPLEMALLPAVESGFDPQARSPSKARGLWQFVPTTARSFGLRENSHYDGRRDVVASTRAALDYLQRLNRRFDSWLLALAAYNVGTHNLLEAIRAAGTDNFWQLDLPDETREHVPRLLGVALLIKQPARFGVELPPMQAHPPAEMIFLDRAQDLAAAARRAHVAQDTIELYNPGLKKLSDTGGKRVLLLPPDDAARLRTALAGGAAPAPPPKNGTAIEHTIAQGDSLWLIARHYNVSVAQLREWNALEVHSRLQLGQKLRILPAG